MEGGKKKKKKSGPRKSRLESNGNKKKPRSSKFPRSSRRFWPDAEAGPVAVEDPVFQVEVPGQQHRLALGPLPPHGVAQGPQPPELVGQPAPRAVGHLTTDSDTETPRDDPKNDPWMKKGKREPPELPDTP